MLQAGDTTFIDPFSGKSVTTLISNLEAAFFTSLMPNHGGNTGSCLAGAGSYGTALYPTHSLPGF